MVRSRLRFLAPILFAVPFLACSSSSSNGGGGGTQDTGTSGDGGVDEGPPMARFALPSALSDLDDDHFFDHPWPSDFRREADGSVRLDGYVNPRELVLVKKYQTQMKGALPGFSPFAAGYLGFTNALDPNSLPKDEKSSTASTSSIQLVDVDPASPDVGKRWPIRLYYRDAVGDYYTVPHTLAWMPALGVPMRPHTQYAVVATNALKTASGAAWQLPQTLQDTLAGKGALANWKTALDQLEKAGVSRSSIVHLSVFTTYDPTSEVLAIADQVRANPAPQLTDLVAQASAADYDRYFGHYSGSPDYQVGTPPFSEDGGNFTFDSSGKPVKQRDFSLRFLLTVPNAAKCPMPVGGYPIILYAHGTGGDYESFDNDGTAESLAKQCLAGMGIDQIFHGDRPGAPPDGPNKESQEELLFFNVNNILAARTNGRQAAVDEIARARFIATGGLVVSASVSKTGQAITFDATRLGFFGHSQGSLNGPIFLVADDTARGGVLSGAGSGLAYSLLLKTSPEPSVSGLIKTLIDVSPENADEINELHPFMSLAQTLVDPVDPIHYQRALVVEPFGTHKPKNILMTEGVNPDGTGDSFAPPRTIEAGAIAGNFPLLKPVVYDVPELSALLNLSPVDGPLKGNMNGGKNTAALAQFEVPAGDDGHFVVFDVPAATLLAGTFCKSVVTDAVPTLGGN